MDFGIHNITTISSTEAEGKMEVSIKFLQMIENNPVLKTKYPLYKKEFKPRDFF